MSAAAEIRKVQALAVAAQHRLGLGHAALLALSFAAVLVGAVAWSWQIGHGMVGSGLERPVAWGVYITDFVFWVGIAHSGTLISAILFLFRARFRTAVYRIAEAMTVFGVMTAGLFPIVHLGRPWFAYWLFPYPNQRRLWVNFRSPLLWDVFAVSTYFIISATFLWVGMVPDAAALRDASTGWRRRFYTVFSVGWRGTSEEWRHFTRSYLFFAALATPLVISVHSVVSWDFAVSMLPGWHSTIFPPYFVAGAIFSGVAMVVTLLIPLRRALHLEDAITAHHLDMLARVVLLTSLIVTYSYLLEFGLALRGPPSAERATLVYRATGDYAGLFWLMILCNSVLPLLLFVPRLRRSPAALWPIALAVNVGMWLERFVIIVSSLSHDRLPYLWRVYHPRPIELAITLGSFGWFFFWFLLFVKFLPTLSIAELKEEAAHAGAAQMGLVDG
ncbi:MAG: NrfD/PsrC family molybdoenzyme membrane anchor subunit [Myxococcales bacterium]